MMPSQRMLSVLAFAAISIIVLLVTSHRLGTWSYDGPSYVPGLKSNPNASTPSSHAHDEPAPVDNLKGSDDFPPRVGSECTGFPDTSDILLVMKTGASEAYNRIPTQALTMLKCLPDFLLFSDMDQQIAGYHIYDSLDTVLYEAKAGNSDFDLYRRQQACAVDQENCNKQGDPATEGWNLDKYKNTHMAEKAFRLRPNYKWYVFVDADTYVVWPNIVQWLGPLDSTKKLYFGSATMIANFPFAHGGSGYIVSHAAMKAFAGDNPGVANKYDIEASHQCCGDFVFAKALKETTDVGVANMWPTVNGEKPFTLPYRSGHWCNPFVTMHHMNSEEISTMWDYEKKRYGYGEQGAKSSSSSSKSQPDTMLLRDIYHEFFEPKLRELRVDWDNLSDDTWYLNRTDPDKANDWRISHLRSEEDMNELELRAHVSPEHCRAACDSVGESDCFQYSWAHGVCAFSRSFKLGKPTKIESNENKRMVSGWLVDKIRAFDQEEACDNIEWPSPY